MKHLMSAALLILAALPLLAQDSSALHTHVDLRIRSGPGAIYETIAVARPCQSLTLLAESDGWYRIQHDGGEGYVVGWLTHEGAPHCDSDPAPDQLDASASLLHTHDYLNVRAGPGAIFAAIGVVAPCVSLTVLGGENGWYKIQHGSGAGFVAGWIPHTGPQHCDDESAPSAQPAAPADNKCFSDWDWCSDGAEDINTFWWNLGWCVAGEEAGSLPFTISECMGRFGTPLASDFAIPGYDPPAEPVEDDSDSREEEIIGDSCDPSSPNYNYGQHCWTDF